jgi:TonB family protein
MSKKLRLTVAAAVGMLVLVGGSLVVFPTLQNRLFRRSAAVAQDTSPLSLRVERTSGGLQLSWDLHSPVIQGATKVMLGITDGDRHENIQLDPNQVRSGSIVYPPISGDVSFQMEVTDPHQTKITSESLRVLDPRPSPLADPADPAANSAKSGSPTAKPAAATTTATETPAADDAKPQEEAAPAHVTTPLKPFNTETLADRLRPAAATDLPEAPAIVRATPAASGNLAGIEPNQPVLPPQPKQASSGASPASSAVVQGGQLQKARLVSRREPEYPKIARTTGASGTVALEATIGVDGKVKNAKVISGNPMLKQAAIDAVLEWRYEPAMLNGKPVESPVEIKLNFVPGH